MGLIRRLRQTFSGRDDTFAEEMQFHLDRRIEDYVADGLSPDEARRKALRQFGNAASLREQTRDADSLRWLGDLATDIRYGLRTLARNPAFAVVAIATLALGIGANTAVFAAAYGVLLRPLPYDDPSRIVRLSEYHENAVSPLRDDFLTDLTFEAWRPASETMEGMGTYTQRAYTVTGRGDADRVEGAVLAPEIFGILRVTPAVGRFFVEEEAIAGADHVVVLAHEYWRQHFAGREDAVGQSIELDGRPHVIVGVAPAGFSFPEPDRQLYTPFLRPRAQTTPGTRQGVNVFWAIGRLRPGVTAERAAAEGTAITRALGPRPQAADLLFGKGGLPTVRVQGLADQMTAAVRPILLLLVAGVALILLLACANVANLLLSLGVTRERELAVRAAIGAGRGRLRRQLLAESLALSTVATTVGLGLALLIVRAWPIIVPVDFPRLAAVRLDWTPILFAGALSMLASVLVGVAPALHGSRVNVGFGLSGGRGASMGQRSRRTRQALLVVQAAFAVVLVVGAALLVRSFDRLVARDNGYDATHVIAARVTPQGSPIPAARWQQRATAIVDSVRAVPGVQTAGASNMAPLGDTTMIAGFRLAGDRPEPVIARGLGYVVTPGYLATLQLRLREGRLFTDSDVSGGLTPLIVNDDFVRAYFSDGRPVVGRRFDGIIQKGRPAEIVGVVGNVLKNGLTDTPQPEFYAALGNHGGLVSGRDIYLVIRSQRRAADLAPALRAAVRAVDPTAPLHNLEDLSATLADTAGDSRFAASSVTVFAGIALALAAIGLYGGLMYAVSRRTREMGIRTALGARPAGLIAIVVREGLAITAAGGILGLGAAMFATRVMRGLLYGVDPLDAVSFAAAPVLLAVVAVTACLIPAWRTVSTSPVDALRQD
jgi:putative ABC transport system permease protein